LAFVVENAVVTYIRSEGMLPDEAWNSGIISLGGQLRY
jgi:hypothetical protein